MLYWFAPGQWSIFLFWYCEYKCLWLIYATLFSCVQFCLLSRAIYEWVSQGFSSWVVIWTAVHVEHLWDETFTIPSVKRKFFPMSHNRLYKLWTESTSSMELQNGYWMILPWYFWLMELRFDLACLMILAPGPLESITDPSAFLYLFS